MNFTGRESMGEFIEMKSVKWGSRAHRVGWRGIPKGG
jgi:hypothetical protein